MRFSNLTPENQLRLHLTQAQSYWLEDRLDLADAAMRNALRVGIPAGHWYNLQRTIEAELGAREACRFHRITEELIIEAAPQLWGGFWPTIIKLAVETLRTVTNGLDVRWGKPLLLTLIPNEEWVAFMHARYGYYSRRSETHKVCLPPSAVGTPGTFRRAALHELAHAAVHQLAGENAPRWLDEGLAVYFERRGRFEESGITPIRLDELSGYFESHNTELNSAQAQRCYATAGDFIRKVVAEHGLDKISGYLCSLGSGGSPERAFQQVFGVSLRSVENEWLRNVS
jgi:hypothetical protein